MVDIHSHILHGMDDGAKTLEISVAMLEMAAADGITDIVASPHANNDYTFDPDLIEARIRELAAALTVPIRIHRGCDFHLTFDNIEDALRRPDRYTINHRRYLLVEFSDLLIPKTSGEVFERMLAAGIVPVVTHPERNALLRRKWETLENWADAGCLMQVTAGALLGRWGRSAQEFAEKLMDANLAHVIASDAHDAEHRPPVLTPAYERVAKKWGQSRAEALFGANPAAILAGQPLPQPAPEPAQRKWYRFW
ncbi:MAG: exopolysaccharide biosynthesis protein [Bryobacterales bacterium]|nr:exopolysaccharide biosynthesis protein [Bryobacterales bacterium]